VPRSRSLLVAALIAVGLILPAAAGAAGTPALPLVPPVAQAARVEWAKAQAEYFWAVRGLSILGGFHAGPAAGQCTDFVAARRPDIIERVDVWAYSQRLLVTTQQPIVLVVDWMAKQWAADAIAAGLSTGHVARRNAVIVFQPGAYGATGEGHVAIVDSVSRSGAFTISEMHAPKLGVVSTRHFGARSARAMARDGRITFIYQ
jgi:hypothetical protein